MSKEKLFPINQEVPPDQRPEEEQEKETEAGAPEQKEQGPPVLGVTDGEYGNVTVNGIRYQLGRSFADSEVVEVSPGRGGIYQVNPKTGQRELTHTFDLLDGEDPRINRYQKRDGNFDISVGKKPLNFKSEKTSDPEEKRAEFQERVLSFLSEGGVLRKDGGNVVVDLEKMKRFKLGRDMLEKHKSFFSRHQEFGGLRLRESIANAFLGREVFSEEDWRKRQAGEEVKPKPLFYQPESAEAAFDPQKIRGQEFYLGPWQVGKSSQSKGVSLPTLTGEKVDASENNIACVIYGQNFGNGYRDKNGRLMVRNPNSNEYQPITAEWFADQRFFYGNPSRQGDNIHKSPKIFFDNKTPNLKKRGLVTPEDFQAVSTGIYAKRYRTRRELNAGIGHVMVESVDYYVGKGKRFENSEVVIIAPGIAGVLQEDPISGRKKLTHTFNLLKPGQEGLKPHRRDQQGNVIHWRADRKATNLQEYNPDQFYKPRPDENSDDFNKRKKIFEDFDYLLKFSDRLSSEAGVNFAALDYEQQSVIASATRFIKQDPQRVIGFAKKYGIDGLRSLIVSTLSQERVENVLELAENLPEDTTQEVLKKASHYIDSNRSRTSEILSQINEIFPDGDIEEEHIREMIIHRVSEFFEAVHRSTRSTKNIRKAAERVTSDFESESDVESYLVSRLLKVSEIFERDGIDIKKHQGDQVLLVEAIQDPSYRNVFLRTLAQHAHVEPIPRIFWEVDRTSEEYGDRFGFDVRGLLQQINVPLGEKGVIVEFGPGNGMAKSERLPLLKDKFVDVGISDRMYYPLNRAIYNLIDFDLLEQESQAELSEEERNRLADVIYKVMVLKPGTEAGDITEHDDSVINDIAENPEKIIEYLQNIGTRLSQIDTVPETRCQKDDQGNIIHPDKIKDQEQSEEWQKAKKLFAQAPEKYIKDTDVYSALEVYPQGVTFADFSDIKKLADRQIDIALAVRSTVYKEGEEYDQFLQDTDRKISGQGVWVDDSIRENGGAGYRLDQILKFANSKKSQRARRQTLVVLGPGMPGEDYNQEKVPLAFIRTANQDALDYINKNLKENFELVAVEEFTSGTYDEFIGSLDPDQKSLQQLKTARQATSFPQRSRGTRKGSESSERFRDAA